MPYGPWVGSSGIFHLRGDEVAEKNYLDILQDGVESHVERRASSIRILVMRTPVALREAYQPQPLCPLVMDGLSSWTCSLMCLM